MLDDIKNSNILFLDIETVSLTYKFGDLPERHKDLWAKKMRFYMERDGKTAEELYDKSAIWSEFGKIVCISLGFLTAESAKQQLRVKSFFGTEEKKLLQEFAQLLDNHFHKKHHYLCAHNGKEFDFPYIARRMLVNSVSLPKALQISGKKPWEIKHLDTMELWKFGDHKHYTSLDLLTALFNVDSPKLDMDGSLVSKVFWEENNLQKIVDYCQQDVVALCKVFLKMKGQQNVNQIQVEIVDIIAK